MALEQLRAVTELELTCSVCLDIFKEPILLPCSHSLCTCCAKSLIKVVKGKGPCCCPRWLAHNEKCCELKCPLCQGIHTFDDDCELVLNLALRNLCTYYGELISASSVQNCSVHQLSETSTHTAENTIPDSSYVVIPGVVPEREPRPHVSEGIIVQEYIEEFG